LNWRRKLKGRIAHISTHNCSWRKRWRSTPRREHCPNPKASCSLSRCMSILIPKLRRPYSEGPISNSHVYLCALPTKTNALSQPTIIPLSWETFTASGSQLQAFTVKVQRAERRISSDPRLSKGRHTRGG